MVDNFNLAYVTFIEADKSTDVFTARTSNVYFAVEINERMIALR